jgi:AraC-like DNA-binding protein
MIEMSRTMNPAPRNGKSIHTGDLRPTADSWDGPYFRLCGAGINDFTQTPPPHAMFMDAMEAQGCWEYVLSGAVQYRLGPDQYRVEAGEALITRRPDPGWMLRPVRDVPVQTIWIAVSDEAALSMFDYLHLKYGQIHRIAVDSTAVTLARRLVRLATEQPHRAAHFWSEKTFQWMSAWWRAVEETHNPVGHTQLNALQPSRLISYKPKTVKNFAAEMGYSRAYLTRKLTQQWLRSPGKVLRQVRLEDAAKLLRTTQLSINAIATKVGYLTAAGFCRAFQAHYHQSPRAYRLEHR